MPLSTSSRAYDARWLQTTMQLSRGPWTMLNRTMLEGLALVFRVKNSIPRAPVHAYHWPQTAAQHVVTTEWVQVYITSSIGQSIKRWSFCLSMFEYTLTFRNTTAHANADALSCLPRAKQPVLLATHLESSPVSAKLIAEATRKYSVLSTVSQYVNQGWPRANILGQPQLSSYFDNKNELSTFEGCLLWDSRVVVPFHCQEAVLTTKWGTPRNCPNKEFGSYVYVWWPRIKGLRGGLRGGLWERFLRDCNSLHCK